MTPAPFHPAVRQWFDDAFAAATPIQQQAWPAIARGDNVLIAAPTGSGKTLAAFLAGIDQLVQESLAQGGLPDETRILYVSPLKALSNDIHRNLELPLAGIAERLAADGRPVGITAAVRTGDTTQADRARMRKRPPHILVTTPESLYILLTSASGREMLSTVTSVIVDEIHAVAGSRRGAHLALSLARLDALCPQPPVRVGLSATQKPIEEIARFLCHQRPCTIVDTGYQRERDLSLEVPVSPLSPVMANEVWEEIYDRLAALVAGHATTLIFVNTRRLAERVTRHLGDRLGEDVVMAHHGSLAREQRLTAEQRLKAGQLRAVVATASLELGIDIGDVDLVCQLGSPRSIAGFLQRVGRSGHSVGGTPKGRLFPLSRDDLVECTAVLDAVARGELDRICMPRAPLDVLAQQIVAEVARRPWAEDELYACYRETWSYRDLDRATFGEVCAMLADGFATRRGRRSAYLHRDVVNGQLRPRRSASLTAITNGGAIPDQFDYDVVLRPADLRIGTLNEDFAFESLPGDIFQLGNTSYRVLKVETGRVFVEDAKGQPPTLPFWLGEAPGRSDELSQAVSRLRRAVAEQLAAGTELVPWLRAQYGLSLPAAEQLAGYLNKAWAALGDLPTQDRLILERFFDEVGDLHLVVHSPYGSRLNRALGLSLRKRFCRKFNFELQASALEDSLVLSLGPTHSFDMSEVMGWLHADTVREVLVQALLAAPMFPTRWRWVASIALAVQRMNGGQRRPPQFQRSDAEDLIAVVFPDQLACAENLAGPREIPDHPLVRQAVADCLHEVMDVVGLERLLAGIESGAIQVDCRELTHPSPLAEEILNARPYAFLDDGAAEERRTGQVRTRPELTVADAARFARLDPAVIAEVREEVRPQARDADELHDALMVAGLLTDGEVQAGWRDWLTVLVAAQRVVAVSPAGHTRWLPRERLHEALEIWPVIDAAQLPEPLAAADGNALVNLLRSRLEVSGPVTAASLADVLRVPESDIEAALLALEAEGQAIRGTFEGGDLQWCNRRVLARIHRRCLQRRRAAHRPVDVAAYQRFLLRWQGLERPEGQGRGALETVLRRLEGCSMPAGIIETEILSRRLVGYAPQWLDELCRSGELTWLRLRGSDGRGAGQVAAVTPIALLPRRALKYWLAPADDVPADVSAGAARVFEALDELGALFFDELREETGLLETQLESALTELVAAGALHSDAFHGIRFLAGGARRKERQRRYARRGMAPRALEDAGRWSRIRHARREPDRFERAEYLARALLNRYGVLLRALLDGQPGLPPWRDLLYALHRMEAREEIHGGRFVDGFAGEQFALPDAVVALRAARDRQDAQPVVIAGADPANLTGILLPGARVPATAGNRLALVDGVPVAALIGGEVRALDGRDPDWALRQRLVRDPGVLAAPPSQVRRPPTWLAP